ncbi:MAG TPA: NAD(P)H-hydrate dehydratase [Candidatus Nitrosocosmicus sp.]|nr:NAD(P)H-hydrate dehydratase [Candidatus Nitrosocosmicus sp.]
MKDYSLVDDELIRRIVKPRNILSRKGENGIALVVGGSRLYHGAPLLSSLAALRSGTDLVYTAIPKINLISSRIFSPDLIILPFPDDKLTNGSVRRLINSLPKKIDAAAIGMGLNMSKSQPLSLLIRELLADNSHLVIDAGALHPEILPHITNNDTIVTPHAGEFKRLFGDEPTTMLTEQIKLVSRKAKEFGLTIVLKGYQNIVSDGVSTFVLKRTTPSMTVGGTGDILSGLITGFRTKYESLNSSLLGLFFNGKAALRLSNKIGLHMLASDLLTELPFVMKEYDTIN